MQRRYEIDGLRTFAILPILIFHIDKNILPHGYLGVDIFFVISGYLITTIIINNIYLNKFSLKFFLFRRVRRIIPALFVMQIITLFASFIILTNKDFFEFNRSLLSSTFFYSNYFFWMSQDYFDTLAQYKPLLHTWSLSIEIQFYLFFSIFILVLIRYFYQKNMILIFIIIFLCTVLLYFSIFFLPLSKNANFYFLHSRVWELMVGSLAFFSLQYKPKRIQILVNKIKLDFFLFILLIVIFFNDFTLSHPGFITLLSTIIIYFIIVFTDNNSLLKKFLSLKIFVIIGTISYSIYLYHWPVFVFFKYYTFIDFNEYSVRIVSVLIVFLISFLSYLLIEKPFKKLGGGGVGVLFLMIIFLIFPLITNFFLRDNLAVFNKKYLEASFKRLDKKELFFDEYFDLNNFFKFNDQKILPTFFVFGDSHAYSSAEVFGQVSKELKINGNFAGIAGCLPFLNMNAHREYFDKVKKCKLINDKVYEYIKKNKNIKKLILVARYDAYLTGGYNQNDLIYHYIGDYQQKFSLDELMNYFEKGLVSTINLYEKIGVKIYIIQQIPIQKVDPYKFYHHLNILNISSDLKLKKIKDFSIKKKEFKKLIEPQEHIFKKYSNKINYVKSIDNFCDESTCNFGDKNKSFYSDHDHLSNYGSLKMMDKIIQIFD